MTPDTILEDLEPIVRDIFDDYEGPVTRELSARDVAQWDSLANVQFMVMVEKAFRVKFTNAEITGLKNVGELTDLVAAKSAKSS